MGARRDSRTSRRLSTRPPHLWHRRPACDPTGETPVPQHPPEEAEAGEPTAFEMTLSDDANVRFAIADAEALDRERRTILEELCRQAGVRLASL